MITILKGVGLLLLTLAVFSVFSMKAPKGSDAMSGMANAAIASFLVEAVHKYRTLLPLQPHSCCRSIHIPVCRSPLQSAAGRYMPDIGMY